jgi:6-phosphofructokinase 2
VASGSLPPGVPDDFYGRVARLVRERGARLILDTSGPALGQALAQGVFMVKPNLNELAGLTGALSIAEEDAARACRRLVAEKRVDIVALTLGNRGALLTTADATWRAPALPVETVSAVGAGDSFVGAMVWSLAAGHSIEMAFRYGVAGGSAALLTPGTELCRADDVVRLVDQVVLQQVDP